MSIEGRAFLKLFRDAAAVRLAPPFNVGAGWKSSTLWTTLMLGSAETRLNKDFGVIGDIGAALGYLVEAEYFRIDQLWSSAPSQSRHEWVIEAFIEHENGIGKIPETVRKLMHLGPVSRF